MGYFVPSPLANRVQVVAPQHGLRSATEGAGWFEEGRETIFGELVRGSNYTAFCRVMIW